MKSIAVCVLFALLCSAPAMAATPAASASESAANDKLKTTLVDLERQSWEAWKGHDGKFFSGFLSDDHVEVGFQGPAGKTSVVADVSGPECSVESYAVDNFQLTRISVDTALLIYHAQQKTLCGAVAVPSPVWASSLYVKRGGRWLNVMYQQSLTNK